MNSNQFTDSDSRLTAPDNAVLASEPTEPTVDTRSAESAPTPASPEKPTEPAEPKKSTAGRTVIWILLSFTIALISIYAIISQNRKFSFGQFMEYLRNSDKFWLCCAFAGMLGFILFEALSLKTILRGLSYRKSFLKNTGYSVADIYFSAITPSATGGQPASAYLMMRDKIPGSVTTVSLLINLMMYAVSIVILGVLCFLVRPGLFFSFDVFPRVLILVGIGVQIGLSLLFLLLIKKGNLLCSFACKCLHLGAKLHLVHNVAKKEKKLRKSLESYTMCAEMSRGKYKMFAFSLLFNILQRSSQIAVTVFTYLATGGSARNIVDVFSLQSYVVLGAAYIPIPGGMGVTEYLMINCLSNYMTSGRLSAEDAELAASNLGLLSRAISFYSCVLLCGFITLLVIGIPKLIDKLREKNRK